jgi:rare lipoprotein A
MKQKQFMKKVTLAVVLLVFLSFTVIQTNEFVEASSPKDSLSYVPTDTVKETTKNDTLVGNEIQSIEEEEEEIFTGRVSWYGGQFHGRLTSSGEKYDMNDITAAHKTLPFGTKVKITNPRNGKEVIVRIIDRGPFVPKREFDLSKAAFAKLTSLNSGVINVIYEVL